MRFKILQSLHLGVFPTISWLKIVRFFKRKPYYTDQLREEINDQGRISDAV